MRKFAFLFILLFAIFLAFSQTTYSTISSSSVLDWNSASSWEDIDGDGTGDIPVITGTSDITITLNAPVTASSQFTFNSSGNGTITIDTNGYTLTCSSSDGWLLVDKNSNTYTATITVTGGGTVSIQTLDFPDTGSHSITIDSSTTFRIEDMFYGDSTTANTMSFLGNGTLYIPASGANIEWKAYGPSYANTLTILPIGNPTYYKITSDGSSLTSTNGIGITFTAHRYGSSSQAIPFTYTAVAEGSSSLTDFTLAGSTLTSSGSVSITATGTGDKTLKRYLALADSSATLSAGDGVTVTFLTPDKSMVLAEISWIKDKPHWTGLTSTDWNTETNWSTGSVPDSASDVVIPSGCSQYPILDSSVADVKTVSVKSNAYFTVASGGSLKSTDYVTCSGNSHIEITGGTLASALYTMEDYGYIEATSGTVEFTATSTWNPLYPARSTFYNVLIDSGATVTAACDITVKGNWTNNGTFVPQTNKVIFSGDDTQSITGGTGGFYGFEISSGSTVEILDDFSIAGTATIEGDISADSTGKITFEGSVTCSDDVTLGCDFDFASSGTRSFTAPAGKLYLAGNADFSLCQSLTNSSGKIYFSNTAAKTFTSVSAFSFNDFYVAGTGSVTFDGTVVCCNVQTETDSEKEVYINGEIQVSEIFNAQADSTVTVLSGGVINATQATSLLEIQKDAVLVLQDSGELSGAGKLCLISGILQYMGTSSYSVPLETVISNSSTTQSSIISTSATLSIASVTYTSYPNLSVTGFVELQGGTIGELTVETEDSELTFTSDNLTCQGEAKLNGSVTSDENQIYMDNVTSDYSVILDSSTNTIIFYGNVTSVKNQIYKSTVSCANSIAMATGSSYAVQSYGGITTSSSNTLTVSSDLYVCGAGTLGGGTGAFTVSGNVYFSCTSSSDEITIDSSFTANNAVLMGGILSFGSNASTSATVTAANDLVLLNGNTSSMYADGDGTGGTSGVSNLFRYVRSSSDSDSPDTASSTLTSLPTAYPDGTTGFPDGTTNAYCGYIDSTALAGKTLTCGKNFYANGVTLASSGSGSGAIWNLVTGDTDNSTTCFAEMYNLTVANCNSTYWVSAAEGCTDGSGSTNIDFVRPTIIVNDSSVSTSTDLTANSSGTYTLYDDVIRVEFSESIENSNNEISAATTSSIYYSGGAFAGTYVDSDCTTSTDGQGDLQVFYIKTNSSSSYKWNTDATGISSGDSQSTTRDGTSSSQIPYLNVPKALSAVFATLRDSHKNRIGHYYSSSPSIGSSATANSAIGSTFTAVADRCSPVLIGVQIGQELHTPYSVTYDSQPPYDAHNFIEFQYSEEVEIPGLSTTGANSVNVRSSTSLGNITGTSGLTITGLAQLSSGSISCGSNDATANSEIHALYRNFATTLSGASGALSYNSSYSNPQTHRVRVALASFTSGTVTPADSKTYRKWPGYIDSLVSPVTASGTGAAITRFSNANIKDVSANQNVLDSSGTAPNHTLPAITVNKRLTDAGTASQYDSILYGAWDTTEPSFAPFRAASAWQSPSSSTEYESLGTGLVGSTTLNRIEMHLFDNKPAYNSTDEAAWRSKRGWVSGTGDSDTNLKVSSSYAADIFGGAKPFTVAANPLTASLVTGGIRYSSLYNQASRFKYTDAIAHTPSESFASSDILHEVKANVFNEYNVSRPVTSLGADSLYFSLSLESSTNFSLKQKFKIYYDGFSGTITDLAGNRLKSATIQTVDLTPPEFSIALAPLGNNKLYLLFTKVLNTEEITDPANPAQNLNVLENIPKSFEIVDIAGASRSTALQINESVPAQIVYTGNHSTAFILTLNANVTLNDVRNLCVAVKNNGSGEDPVTRLTANVSYIQDYIGNYTPVHKAHALSDFAVGAVNVNYAYDNRLLDEEGSVVSNLLNADSWAIHDFDADQKNYGTLLADHDITINLSLYDGTSDNSGGLLDSSGNLLLGFPHYYADTSPDKKSLATEFNENTGSSCRIWLPDVTTDVFKAFSAENNTGYVDFQGTALSGNSLTFTLPVTTDSLYSSWKAGNQVSFIFGLTDSSDNNIKIRHTPVYPSEDNYNGVSGTEYPLYAVRQLSSSDFASIDLWSFRLKNIVLQRGGVTILNNVINVNSGESSVVQVDMPSAGNLNVIVMTLDGNVIKYLHHGRADEGTHYYYWDGRNNGGNKVARGLYFVRVAGEGIDETRKIMVIKE